MKKLALATLATVLALSLDMGALAAALTEAEYTTEKSQISVNMSADKKACAVNNGHAKDTCMREARGRRAAARAQLEENQREQPRSQ